MKYYMHNLAINAAEVDPKLLQALHIVQYTAQYVDAGNALLKQKEGIIKRGIKEFQNEEDETDLELSKLRYFY